MTRENEVGAIDADEPVQAGAPQDSHAPAARESNIVRRENAVTDDEAVVLSREKLALAREDSVHLREGIADQREDAACFRELAAQMREGEAHVREGVATSRESDVRAAETARATSDDQLLMLQQANARLVIASIEAHKMTEQIEMAKVHLDHLAHHDVLTDLPNRMLLQDRLTQAIDAAHRQGGRLALMYMDLDLFKHINDSLGHAVGDHLLQSVAKRLVGCVRQSDTVSRQGGDEFVLLLPLIEHAEDAALSAEKAHAALTLPHHVDGNELHVSVSIGISIYPDDGLNAQTLIKCADTAMYYAKESGRNNYRFFEPGMNARAVQRQTVEAGLRRALAEQEFVLHYQPKINLESGAVVGVEALIRWQHPELGLLSPADFVSIAEDCGLILPIGRWVLREACRQAQAWLLEGLPPITVAVNTSALEFRAKDFLFALRTILAETGLEPRNLELELTESVLMRDAESADSVLHALAKMGVKLAIDDFGTGCSSLSYLQRFPINALKIDQSFVKQMSGNPDDSTIVNAVISMGKSLKLRVIAEGVETPEQASLLRAQRCDEGQGYFFCRPMPPETLTPLFEARAFEARAPH